MTRGVVMGGCAHEHDCFDYPDTPIGKIGDQVTHDSDWPCCDLRAEHWHLKAGTGVHYDAPDA
jgi:hypothetical protein